MTRTEGSSEQNGGNHPHRGVVQEKLRQSTSTVLALDSPFFVAAGELPGLLLLARAGLAASNASRKSSRTPGVL